MAVVELFRNGFASRPGGVCASGDSSVLVGKKRGQITSASKASFRRLREFCVTHYLDEDCFGLTLTVPGLDIVTDSDFRKAHHKLVVWCNDNKVPLVWRIELQQRRQPHIHCVTYGTQFDALRICKQWYRCLHKMQYTLSTVSKDDFALVPRDLVTGSRYAVTIDRLSGDFASWRYLVAHMAKSKRDQLGWKGRQWGVCCRSLFVVSERKVLYLTESEYAVFSRYLRRMVMPVDSPFRYEEKRSSSLHPGKYKSKFNPNSRYFSGRLKEVCSSSLDKGKIKRFSRRRLKHRVNKFLCKKLGNERNPQFSPDRLTCAFWVCDPVVILRLVEFAKSKFKTIPF